jgi:hypothetical protein
MPVRRRIASLRARQAHPVEIFTYALASDFSDVWGDGERGFASVTQAAKAWPVYRREIWAGTERFRVPKAATVFDGMTLLSLDALRYAWQLTEYRLHPTIAPLAIDRANLERFASTAGGKTITDYLDILRSDLTAIEEAARTMPASWIQRPYPAFAIEACYGSEPRATAPTKETIQ